MIRSALLPLFAAGMLSFAGLHVVRNQQRPPRAEPAAAPAHVPYADVVAGVGLVEPQSENIAIGAHLPGIVARVPVAVGRRVAAGDVLFTIDTRAMSADLKVKQALLAAAVAQRAKLEAMPRAEEKPVSAAKVREARAVLADRTDTRDRAQRLRVSRANTQEDLVRAEQAYQMAVAQLERGVAEDKLLLAGAWQADKSVADTSVEQAKAQVLQTQTELERHEVRAPIDGHVLQVNVRPGEFVGAPPGKALIVLGNIDRLHLRVDIDETDIPRFHTEAKAEASVRGNDRRFPLRFVRIEPYVVPKKSLTGESTERVDTRVLQVIYHVEASAGILFVGQQMDAFIDAGPSAIAAKGRDLVAQMHDGRSEVGVR